MSPKKATIAVKALPKELLNDLAEIYSSGWECCFVSSEEDGYKQVNQIAFCKDFLNDVIYGFANDKKAELYGMVYDKKTHPLLDLKKTRLLVRNKKSKQSEFFGECERAAELLRKAETIMRFRRTRLYKATLSSDTGDTQYCVFESSPRWMKATPLLSLYSILARCGKYYTKGETVREFITRYTKEKRDDNDARYLSSGLTGGRLKCLLENNTKLFNTKLKSNYQFDRVNNAHEMGFQAWARRTNNLPMNWKNSKEQI